MCFDPYEVLEVDNQASEKEIKKAYHLMMFKFHPDRNHSPDAELVSKRIVEAYGILTGKTTFSPSQDSDLCDTYKEENVSLGFWGVLAYWVYPGNYITTLKLAFYHLKMLQVGMAFAIVGAQICTIGLAFGMGYLPVKIYQLFQLFLKTLP